MKAVEKVVENKLSEGQLRIDRKEETKTVAVVPRYETLESFRRYLGLPSATFKSVAQSVGLETMMRLEKSALMVLATGCGKTAFYLCLAKQLSEQREHRRFIVVFAPFISLMSDILSRAREKGIWANKLVVDGINEVEKLYDQVEGSLLVISANQGHYELVVDMLRTAAEDGRLIAIVLDEAHLYYDLFRKMGLEKLVVIDRINVPLYLLSGSVKPCEERYLLEMFRKSYEVNTNRTKRSFSSPQAQRHSR